jgi:hypothetical protein
MFRVTHRIVGRESEKIATPKSRAKMSKRRRNDHDGATWELWVMVSGSIN